MRLRRRLARAFCGSRRACAGCHPPCAQLPRKQAARHGRPPPLPPTLAVPHVTGFGAERCAPWEHVRPDTLANLLPIYLSYQGLAMKRAGAFGEAEALYEAGLRHIASSACARIVPPERESLRIMLLRLLITLHSAAGTERKSHDAFARLFQRWSC